MAITRAQQVKQMLRNGGMSLQEAKDMAPKGEFLAYINNKEANMLKKAGGSGVMTKAGIPSFIEYDDKSGSGFESAKSTGSVRGDVDRGRNGGSNIVDEVALVTGPKTKTKTKTKTKDKDKILNFVPSFLKARQKGLYNLIPNNPKRELQFLADLRITNPAKYNSLPQNLKDLLESTDQDFAPSFKDSPKLSFEDFDALTQFDDGAFAQYAKDRGSPGLSVSGDMSKVGVKSVRRDEFGNPVKDMFGNILFDYDELRGDRGDPSILLPQGS